jgi:exodeoxyribonuclease-5
VRALQGGQVPVELAEALPEGLSATRRDHLERGARTLDELTCTTIHGFCQQLVRPYPLEAGIDPGAAIADPAAAELAFTDLMQAWLSARFGRAPGGDGLGRIPPLPTAGGEDDFLAELLLRAPDETLKLIQGAAQFLKTHRTAGATGSGDLTAFGQLAAEVDAFSRWYESCGVEEASTGELLDALRALATLAREAGAAPPTGRRIAALLFHARPPACKKDDTAFKQWGRKGKWREATKSAGRSAAAGDQLSAAGEAHYQACADAYRAFCDTIGALAFRRFVAEFDAVRALYRQYKRDAALLDFDDLLHHARDLLRDHEPVRRALARRYPRLLVDEFQDTDPLQAEILWLLAGEGGPGAPWSTRTIRAGALFLVGDPKQAIYRFRGADVQTYLAAKDALARHDPASILAISANFRSQRPVLDFVNAHFARLLDASNGQPGFTPLDVVRPSVGGDGVAALDVRIEERHLNAKGAVQTDAARSAEAEAVADAVLRLIGTYPVWDAKLGASRPARAGDIALLAPTGTSLWLYERALERRDIAIATQAGKGFFRRQEVQDLIAIARAISDSRDTLALGALLRGPLVGLTDEAIADEIHHLRGLPDGPRRLNLWTEVTRLENAVLRRTMEILQSLARKARRATPHQLLAEAIEELGVRAILKGRHPRGAERALANVELLLEMSRAYAARGIADFSRALWASWEEGDSQVEGRPDAGADAVSIITMHSAKGLEWPIVIPINSMTKLSSNLTFLVRRGDDSVHFRIFGYPSPEYVAVAAGEEAELARERVRLWYVALTRARDLLLLPRHSQRNDGDWLGLLGLDLAPLPALDTSGPAHAAPAPAPAIANAQDLATWERQAAAIAAAHPRIVWHQPSRHEGDPRVGATETIYADGVALTERAPEVEASQVQGGRERGVILHKLIEEMLTGETAEEENAARERASELITQLGAQDHPDPQLGPSSTELGRTAVRALRLPEIATSRARLMPEFRVYGVEVTTAATTLTAGIADAVALDASGRIETVIDWKSDVRPDPDRIALYRAQVQDYLEAAGAPVGLIVFVTTGQIVRVERPARGGDVVIHAPQ